MPPPDYREINRLGRRLARTDPPDPADVAALGDLEARYVPALQRVRQVLRDVLGDPPRFEGLELAITTRPMKTVGTILDKLRREHTRLSTMQDIAGVRIVGDIALTLSQQDRLVDRIARAFEPRPKEVDRRADPSYGYRAVHVIPDIEGYAVEIQIRTHMQHVWAELMERLADGWGRSIRYGGAPQADTPELLAVRRQVVERCQAWAGTITEAEDLVDEYAHGLERVVELEHRAGEGLADPAELARARDELSGARAELDRKVEQMVSEIRAIGELFALT